MTQYFSAQCKRPSAEKVILRIVIVGYLEYYKILPLCFCSGHQTEDSSPQKKKF